MGMFRSETMCRGTLVLPADRARDYIELLGVGAHVEFRDMNAASMQRAYRRYIQRLDEMERILRFLYDELKRIPGIAIAEGDADSFLELPAERGYQLDNVEAALQQLYTQFQNFRANNDDLCSQRDAACEQYAVCRTAAESLQAISGGPAAAAAASTPAATPADGPGVQLFGFSNIAGVLAGDERERFARTVFRASRGNAFTYFEPLAAFDEGGDGGVGVVGGTASGSDGASAAGAVGGAGAGANKVVFVIYFQQVSGGFGESSALREKLTRICHAFGVNMYEWPRNIAEARERLQELSEVIVDKSRALAAFEEFIVGETVALLEIHRGGGGGALIDDYRLFCLREKAIYATLNMFEASDVTLRAECWFPAAEEEQIRRLLTTKSSANRVSAFLLSDSRQKVGGGSHGGGGGDAGPPTYIRTTDFTEVFQSFVDTYGVPRYKEANPALLTIVTFPFLFGIMYGDIGHGCCVLAFGLFLIWAWPKLRRINDEMVQMIAGGRYMIMLMGCFAVYAGFLYNDFFSLGLNLFGSAYSPAFTDASGRTTWTMNEGRGPYPFGLDPVWKGAENELLFTNSFKMKFAVIVAFVQMTAGIILKGMNCIYFHDALSFIFEFIPQLIFMFALVGFMDLLIIVKWVAPVKEDFFNGNNNKPSVITTIIDMCMMRSSEALVFRGQQTLMTVCFVLMLISIPIMLLPKPLILKWRHSRAEAARAAAVGTGDRSSAMSNGSRHGHQLLQDIEEDVERVGGGVGKRGDDRRVVAPVILDDEEDEEEFEFGEIMIHQMIETIEFVLGAISNTASYLRLWALSLAHQQLSVVFFQMTIELILKMELNVILLGILLFFVFAIFAGITFGIMLCMDTLECFLHALRLQWVEFQNKFYRADGRPFIPLSFKRVLTAREF